MQSIVHIPEIAEENTPFQLDANIEFSLETELRDLLQSKIIGQGTSTDQLASIIASRMYGIAPRKGPIAVLYLSGPTGVGKTETCHTLAEYFFGDPHAFVEIHGEDYQDYYTSRNLFGGSKNLVGYGEATLLNDTFVYAGYNQAMESGKLNKHIAGKDLHKNFSIVLLDEVEKMHPAIHQNLLGIFDKGKFHFPTGKEHKEELSYSQVTDFSNTIFILTSNIGEHENNKSGMGFNVTVDSRQKDAKENTIQAIKKKFSPEFRGRITEFLHYEPLERADIEKICGIYMDRVTHCIKDFGITLNNSPEVIPGLVDIFEKEQKTAEGARGLQKIVQKRLDGVLARILHSGQLDHFPDGQIQINASYKNDMIQFFAQILENPADFIATSTKEDVPGKIKKTQYHLYGELSTILQMYKRVAKAGYFSTANYIPYLMALERKLMGYGFTKADIHDLDREVSEKVEREIDKETPALMKKRKTLEKMEIDDIFKPFSIQEMQELVLLLWKSHLKSTSKSFQKHHSELRLALIHKAVRDTLITFLGHTIRKDQSIWIGQEMHQLYLKAKASL